MKRIFLDTDIILDVLTKRKPFYSESKLLFNLIEEKRIEASTSTLIIANLHFIISKEKTKRVANNIIQKLMTLIHVIPFEKNDIVNSIVSNFKDFEDGIQNYTASRNKMECLITRNVKDYKNANINVFHPKEFLKIYEESSPNK